MAERIDHKDFRSYEYGRGRNRNDTVFQPPGETVQKGRGEV